MINLLNSTVKIRKIIEVIEFDSIFTTGFLVVNIDNIDHLNLLFDNELIEVLDVDKINNVFKTNLGQYLDKKVYLELRTGNVSSYYETFNDFLQGNKFKLQVEYYFIAEIDYFNDGTVISNNVISNYNKNIEFLNLLESLSHTNYDVGNQLKYYFYRVSNSIIEININYSINDLNFFSDLEGIIELKDEFSDPIRDKDKKELFINELVNFVEKNSSDYLSIVKNWQIILDSYNKSYKLYLAGFSFEKIKTSSNDHFQKLLDKTYDSISKVSGYIFGIPIGFILLLNYFDYSGILIFKNFIILLLSIIFFILIWFILLTNIKESIDAIEDDINDFIDLIGSVSVLESIKEKLETIKNVSLKKQRTKLLIVKGVSISIFALTVIVFLFIFFDISIYNF